MTNETDRQFKKATLDMRWERQDALDEVETRRQARVGRKERRHDRLVRKAAGTAAVASAVLVTAAGFGHQTVLGGLRDMFPDSPPTATNPQQNERMDKINERKTGEPVILDQQ